MEKRKFSLLLGGVLLIIFGIFLSIPDGKLRLIFCDVGQGDGAIITKGTWEMVIDTGNDNGKMERCIDHYLPFWDKKIEAVIVSHWDKDHSGALTKIMKNYKIGRLYESAPGGEEIEQKVCTEKLRGGDVVRYGKISFEVVYPREYGEVGNDSSLVVVVNYKDKRFLFSGDVDLLGEGEMMNWWKKEVEGIKVSHHGSEGGSGEEWLKILKPKIAVISVGKNNYGHPSKMILERLENLGIKVLRTDIDGDVLLGW